MYRNRSFPMSVQDVDRKVRMGPLCALISVIRKKCWLQPKAVIPYFKSVDSHENLRVLNGTEDSLWRNNLPLSGPI